MDQALGEQSRSELVNAQPPMTDGSTELRMKTVVRLRQPPNKEHKALVQILAYAASYIKHRLTARAKRGLFSKDPSRLH